MKNSLQQISFLFLFSVLASSSLASNEQSGTPSTAKEVKVLSIEGAIRLSLQNNLLIQSDSLGVNASYNTYRSIAAFPNFIFGFSQVQGSSSAPSLTGDNRDTILEVSGSFDISGQKRYQAAAAHETFTGVQAQHLESLLKLEKQVRDAYWSLSAAQSQVRIADESVSEANRIYELTIQQERAGTAPKADVLRASIDLANAKQAQMVAKGSQLSAQLELTGLLALSTDADVFTVTDMEGDSGYLARLKVPAVEEALANALKTRPTLTAARSQLSSSGYSLRQVEASRIPDLNVQYQRSAQQQVDALSLTLSFPLFDFGGISHAIRSARDSRRQAELQIRQTELQVKREVKQAIVDLDSAIHAASSYEKEILGPSRQLLEMAKVGYQQGATGILPVLDAESTLRNARVGFTASLLAVHKAENELLAATVPPTPGIRR